jgi:CDP-diacylglycerol--glycerol-3-phosphate 3-phosphatidyltransferase
LALFLFVLAISTDGIDGMIARRTDKVTDLGKFLDPVADKVLIGGALVALSILGEIDWWVTAVILLREVLVTAYRALVAKKVVIAAGLAGKLKTILQGVAIGVCWHRSRFGSRSGPVRGLVPALESVRAVYYLSCGCGNSGFWHFIFCGS